MSRANASLVLCLIDQRAAEHLMGAPALAGGWVAVHPECRQAMDVAGLDGYLALLPSDWAEAVPLADGLRERAVAALAGAYAGPVANEFADRVRELPQ